MCSLNSSSDVGGRLNEEEREEEGEEERWTKKIKLKKCNGFESFPDWKNDFNLFVNWILLIFRDVIFEKKTTRKKGDYRKRINYIKKQKDEEAGFYTYLLGSAVDLSSLRVIYEQWHISRGCAVCDPFDIIEDHIIKWCEKLRRTMRWRYDI